MSKAQKHLEALKTRIRKQVEKAGCPHIGKQPPEKFQCIDCDDHAKECNCTDCVGVFCQDCNEVIWLTCDAVREAYRYLHEETEGE